MTRERTVHRSPDHILMGNYLLGVLSGAEAESVEERFFNSASNEEFVEESESKLIASYVRNELSPTERAAFESHFLSSPENRQATALALAVSRLGSPASLWTRLREWFRAPSPWLVPALCATSAAAVVISIGLGITLHRQESQMQLALSDIDSVRKSNQELERRLEQSTRTAPLSTAGMPLDWTPELPKPMGGPTQPAKHLKLFFSPESKTQVRLISVPNDHPVTVVLRGKSGPVAPPAQLQPVRSATGVYYVVLPFSADALTPYFGQSLTLEISGVNPSPVVDIAGK